MIQRVQSIWLLLAAIVLTIMLFFPILTKDFNGTYIPFYTGSYIESWDAGEFIAMRAESNYPLLITNIAIAIMCLANIFNFKKRSLQKRIIIFTIAAIGGFAFWCSVFAKQLPGGIEGATFGIGAYMPALAILFCVLAIFGINKDERMIRSAERLR